MDFLITFEDGSSACLEHYGVKGMHWGVWNAETRARYADEGNTPQGGGGGDDEEVDEDGYTQKDREEMAGIRPGMTKDEATKYVLSEHKKHARNSLDVQTKQGHFGGTAQARATQKQGLMYDLATAKKHKTSITARAADKAQTARGKAAVKAVMKRMQ